MLNVNVDLLSKSALTALVEDLANTFEAECIKANVHASDVYASHGYMAGNTLGFKHPPAVFEATQDLLRANNALDRLL